MGNGGTPISEVAHRRASLALSRYFFTQIFSFWLILKTNLLLILFGKITQHTWLTVHFKIMTPLYMCY